MKVIERKPINNFNGYFINELGEVKSVRSFREPKEELEELEEIEFAKAGDLIITIINNLIRNQNMIIRKLKANKEQ